MKLTRKTLQEIRVQLNEVLAKTNIDGIEITLGNATFDSDNATFKLKLKVEGALSQDEKSLEAMASLMNLDTTKETTIDGMRCKLVSYKNKAPKFPWVIENLDTNQRYKLQNFQAQAYFGAKS